MRFGAFFFEVSLCQSALKEHRYGGWIVVEQNGSERTPMESSAASYRYIRETLGLP